MSRKWALKVRWVLLGVLMCLLLGLGVDAAGNWNMEIPSDHRVREKMGVTDLDLTRDGMAIYDLFNVSYAMADISLATREQVDFLLTPALLVQQAVSDDVVLTYPEE